MEEVKAFKLSDGRLIEDYEMAIMLQKEIDIKEKVSDFCDEYLMGFEHNELADEIVRKKDILLAALNGF